MASSIRHALRVAAPALCLLVALDAHAQQANSGQLEEIIVTAQKREQNPQDIGISLSAVSGGDLAALGAATATDITKSMPAVVLTQPNGPSSFSLAIRVRLRAEWVSLAQCGTSRRGLGAGFCMRPDVRRMVVFCNTIQPSIVFRYP